MKTSSSLPGLRSESAASPSAIWQREWDFLSRDIQTSGCLLLESSLWRGRSSPAADLRAAEETAWAHGNEHRSLTWWHDWESRQMCRSRMWPGNEMLLLRVIKKHQRWASSFTAPARDFIKLRRFKDSSTHEETDRKSLKMLTHCSYLSPKSWGALPGHRRSRTTSGCPGRHVHYAATAWASGGHRSTPEGCPSKPWREKQR